MEMEPLCHSCMLSMVRNWHMGNPISFSHGHLRLYLATIKAMVNQLGSVTWALLSHLILCTAVTSKNKTKPTAEGRSSFSPVLESLAEGGWEWENHSRTSTCGSLAGQNHMLSGLFHTTLHSVNKMDF